MAFTAYKTRSGRIMIKSDGYSRTYGMYETGAIVCRVSVPGDTVPDHLIHDTGYLSKLASDAASGYLAGAIVYTYRKYGRDSL